MSVDIECLLHCDGSFPVAQDDPVICIGCILANHDNISSPITRCAFYLGECSKLVDASIH